MKTLQTPNNIEVLLHCHCSYELHPRIHAPAVKEAITKLWNAGAITTTTTYNVYSTTPLGNAWVRLLCETPAPTKKLVFVARDGSPIGAAVEDAPKRYRLLFEGEARRYGDEVEWDAGDWRPWEPLAGFTCIQKPDSYPCRRPVSEEEVCEC